MIIFHGLVLDIDLTSILATIWYINNHTVESLSTLLAHCASQPDFPYTPLTNMG